MIPIEFAHFEAFKVSQKILRFSVLLSENIVLDK
jgi:hypothetical protein